MTLTAALPKPPAEIKVIRSLDVLAPKFRAALERLIDAMHAKGLDATIAESLRTNERQAFLYGFGREYDDGRGVVTNSETGYTSWHFYGLAVDIISSSQEWSAPERFWQTLGLYAHREGLTWGGSWEKFPDKPHVQWGPPMRQSPSLRAKELYLNGGIEAVWREVGAM